MGGGDACILWPPGMAEIRYFMWENWPLDGRSGLSADVELHLCPSLYRSERCWERALVPCPHPRGTRQPLQWPPSALGLQGGEQGCA